MEIERKWLIDGFPAGLPLLKEARVEAPEYVTVQLNQQFIGRDDFDTTVLHDGDVVDFLYYMGGGSR